MLSRTLTIIGLVSLTVPVVGLAILQIGHARLLSVESSSMAPLFQKGDALVVGRVGWQHLRLGQVIAYQSPVAPGLLISHRLVRIDRAHGQLTTAGDAAPQADQPIDARLSIGQVKAIVPGLGRVLDGLHRPWPLASLIGMPAGLVIGSELYLFWQHFKQPLYRVHDRPRGT